MPLFTASGALASLAHRSLQKRGEKLPGRSLRSRPEKPRLAPLAAVCWFPSIYHPGVDACGLVVHTGKDCHPEAKRLATLAYWKEENRVAEFFERWPADADRPVDGLLGGPVEDLESTGAEYDPDDAAPWSWDLNTDLFSQDLSWNEFLGRLSQTDV
jgi:hypothetical protein